MIVTEDTMVETKTDLVQRNIEDKINHVLLEKQQIIDRVFNRQELALAGLRPAERLRVIAEQSPFTAEEWARLKELEAQYCKYCTLLNKFFSSRPSLNKETTQEELLY